MGFCLVVPLSVLEEVKGTYHDVRRLEASILELHKMFMDLALLVDRQGEMLDQIEYQVSRRAVRLHVTPRPVLPLLACRASRCPLASRRLSTIRRRQHFLDDVDDVGR